jgi:hypothetical protein
VSYTDHQGNSKTVIPENIQDRIKRMTAAQKAR